MKRVFLIIVVMLAALSCRHGELNEPVVTLQGDTIPSSFVIGERRVGDLERGATLKRLKKIYGENYVKQLKAPLQELQRDSSGVLIYYVYDQSNHLQLVARSEEVTAVDPELGALVIKDDRFTTQSGITTSSTIGEVLEAYPDAMVVQYESRIFLFVSSLDLYCRIDASNIRGYDHNFLVDIPTDSLMRDAHFENMSVNWESSSSNILSSQFWHDLLSRILRWLIYELPVIVFIILIFILAKRLLSFSFKKINLVARNRVGATGDIDGDEAVKRVDTITGILRGVLDIILWSIFVLILLSKFNINIAPILASAGILGLAVGFGAQELVRDFISGFFILLEDQLRTGDMAIINDTTGVVEKIELRTVTLRDPSGVVHIFQNGKINSLSNMTKEWSAIVLEIGVAYKENIDHVMAVMKEVGVELRNGKLGHYMLGDIEIWGLDAFADSAIMIKMVIRTRPMKQWAVKREYLRLLKIRFDADGIEIPFPHVTLYTGDQTKPMPIDLRKGE